jgi:hypothetical protein
MRLFGHIDVKSKTVKCAPLGFGCKERILNGSTGRLSPSAAAKPHMRDAASDTRKKGSSMEPAVRIPNHLYVGL